MSGVGPHKQPVDSKVTMSGSSSKILAYNTGRIHASIQNLGTAIVWVAFGADAVLNQGKSIPVGAIMIIDIQTEDERWAANFINGITDGTSVDLAVSEVSF